MNNIILNTNEKPRNAKEWILYPLQMVMAVFVATVLIATICGTPIDVCLLGGCLGTLIYQCFTKFKSPMFISNSGATVSAVIGALALGQSPNYLAVGIGGIVVATIYILFAFVIKWKGISFFNKIFPATIVGPITIVIGLNLATFIPSYVGMGTDNAMWGVCIAIITMLIIAIVSRYAKGFMRTIPFLIGLGIGYILCLAVELFGWTTFGIIDTWKEIEGIFNMPDFAFLQWNFTNFEPSMLLDIVLLFAPVSICALLEHYSDHKVLSPVIRYRTRDICSLNPEPCKCGRTHIRMRKPNGRTDDMLIIRGVNVFPSQIEEVLLKVSGDQITPNYQIIVDRVNNTDTFDINVEMSEAFFSDNIKAIEKLEKRITEDLRSMLGISAKVHLVNPKSIVRSEGKAKRVIDNRAGKI